MRARPLPACAALLLVAGGSPATAKFKMPSRNLRIVSIDVEGGAAVLFRTREGKSLLIDTGWKPGEGVPHPTGAGAQPIPQSVSADRIAEDQKDQLPDDDTLSRRPSGRTGSVACPVSRTGFRLCRHRHLSAHVGDTLDIGSMHIAFVASDGEVLDMPLPPSRKITATNTRNGYRKAYQARGDASP
jgi:hypothetical protein